MTTPRPSPAAALPPAVTWRARHAQKVRFLLVGAFNTGFGTAVFIALHLLAGAHLHYLGVLLVSHVVAVLVAFALHRRFVFQVAGTGSVLVDLLRFESVYLGALAANLVALPVLVELAGMRVVPAQVLVAALVAVLSWFGHKHFSFRRRAELA